MGSPEFAGLGKRLLQMKQRTAVLQIGSRCRRKKNCGELCETRRTLFLGGPGRKKKKNRMRCLDAIAIALLCDWQSFFRIWRFRGAWIGAILFMFNFATIRTILFYFPTLRRNFVVDAPDVAGRYRLGEALPSQTFTWYVPTTTCYTFHTCIC